MGNVTTVYGCISLEPGFDADNQEILDTWSDEEGLLLPSIFGSIHSSYDLPIVAFAGSYKDLIVEDFWTRFWEPGFVALLKALRAFVARLAIADETCGPMGPYLYLADDWSKPPGKRTWRKYERTKEAGDKLLETF